MTDKHDIVRYTYKAKHKLTGKTFDATDAVGHMMA